MQKYRLDLTHLEKSGIYSKKCTVCEQRMRSYSVPKHIPKEQRTKYVLSLARKESYMDEYITACQKNEDFP